MNPWNSGKPPNEVLVEVECPETKQIIRAKAFYGRDGWRPHWRSEDDNTFYDVHYFRRWRSIEENGQKNSSNS